ncbi:MAG: DUF4416 family protein [Brevinematales bacterium]|jgi:hypothetical protein
MGAELNHIKVKLVMPVLYSDQALLSGADERLQELYGETDFKSPVLPFDYTQYYNQEMESKEIKRIFFSYKNLIEITDLAKIKKETNRIELELSVDGRRHVNLDPGYLELGKFVLATTKDQQHRLYIASGIYEEITLYFKDRQWRSWDWTYPDYRSQDYKDILLKIREIYKAQIK